ncbi:MAG: hypothetical protein U9Q29_08400 [Campylobacterota bacterium]|nr:hypothetical protein [Campylobacterota bacterium]
MTIASYTYQTPSPNAVQVGKLDPSSVKKEEKAEETSQQKSDETLQNRNEVQKSAESFQASQTTEVKPTVTSEHLLDIYA